MDPVEDLWPREEPLKLGIMEVEESGIPKNQTERLRDILVRHRKAFRRAPLGNPQPQVEPMTVKLKPGDEDCRSATPTVQTNEGRVVCRVHDRSCRLRPGRFNSCERCGQAQPWLFPNGRHSARLATVQR